MARYNTGAAFGSASGTTTILAPVSGPQTLSGTAPYTVTLPDPRLYPGIQQVYFNSSTGVLTLSTPSGIFTGAGSSSTSSQTFPTGTTILLESDGTNYIVISEDGGPLIATTITASAAVTLSPASANVVLSPSGTGVVTIGPAAVGTMDNMNIGATTRGTGAFTTLASNNTTTLGATSASSIDSTPIGATTAATGRFTTFTATGTSTLQQTTEVVQQVISPGTGTTQVYTNGSIYYITSMTSNFSLNLTSTPTTTNRSIVITLVLIQGASPFWCNSLQLNGVGQTLRVPGGVNPTPVANRREIQTFTCINTDGSNNFVVFTQLSSYA
jgi:hypothetical protein